MAGTTEVRAGALSESWLHDTLEQLIDQIRALLDVTGVAFVTIDADRAAIRPAAAWFATEEASRAFTPLLQRPYDPTRAGVTEAAVESGSRGADPARRRSGRAPRGCARAWSSTSTAPLAELAWDFYRTASFISCPGPDRRRAHLRRARDLLQPAAARPQRRGPAHDRGVRAARRAGARALRAARARGRPAPRGGPRQPGAAGGRRVDRPRGRLHRDRRPGGGAVGRHAGAADPLRPGRGRAARRRRERRLRAPDARPLQARRGDDRARRGDRRAVRLDDRGQRPLRALGGRDAGRELVHARPDRARRAAVRRPQRHARGPRALRRDRTCGGSPRSASARPARSRTRSSSSTSAGSPAR